MIARDGELPPGLSRTAWKQATGGLLLTAALVVAVMLSFDLSGIAMMGSAAFLLVYAAVNAAHLRVTKQTGASAALVWLSLLTCLAMLAVLIVYIYRQQPLAIAALSCSPSHRSQPNGSIGGGPGEPSRNLPSQGVDSLTRSQSRIDASWMKAR